MKCKKIKKSSKIHFIGCGETYKKVERESRERRGFPL
jgi:hypothetical protein